VESKAWELVAVGSWPFADKFSLYGKLGLYRGDTDASAPGISVSETNTDLTYGFGLRWDFTKNLGARLEYQVYKDVGGGDVGESDAEVMSVGVIWKF
jgi:OOP family OmpA-OmpF porin